MSCCFPLFLCIVHLRRLSYLSLTILWNSAFSWVYLSPSTLPFASLLFSAMCKASSDNHFASLEIRSDQISCSVVSDFLRPHESQHTRPSCPSPTPRVHWDSHPSSQWCHPAISSSVVPFSSCPQSLPASWSFPMSQLFTWGGQSTGVSALASLLPKNTQGWSPSEWTGWISLQSKGLSGVFSNTQLHNLSCLGFVKFFWIYGLMFFVKCK